MKIRPVVFVICLITPRSSEKNHALEFLENVRRAVEVSAELICSDFSVYCPALDFHYWLTGSHLPTAEDIYEQDLSMIRKMDAVFTVGDWTSSPNCKREFNLAWDLNIPAFSLIESIKHWKDKVWERRRRDE